jgi:hypothetical protein
LHYRVTFSPVGPHSFLFILFSDTLSLCFSPKVSDQVSHSCKTTGKITGRSHPAMQGIRHGDVIAKPDCGVIGAVSRGHSPDSGRRARLFRLCLHFVTFFVWKWNNTVMK